MRKLALAAVIAAASLLMAGLAGAAAKAPGPAKGPDSALSSVTVDRTAAGPDGIDPVHITITARDASGQPVPNWRAAVSVTGSGNIVVQPGETDRLGVATAELRSTTAGGKLIHATLSKAGATVPLDQAPSVAFLWLQAIRVQVYQQTSLTAGGNCFALDLEENLPASGATYPVAPPTSDAWGASGAQPKGGYVTWVRALGQSSDSPHDWRNLTGLVTWHDDNYLLGITIDPATGRVTTGAGFGEVHLFASLGAMASPQEEVTLGVPSVLLSAVHINPADDEDPGSASFGPDPIYVPVGSSRPAHVTGTFVGLGAGDYCITADTTLSSSTPTVADVDPHGTVTGVAQGSATVTAMKGAISDSITVNVGPPEVLYLNVTPEGPSIVGAGSIQLHAVAHYTDGSTAEVTSSPGTTWSVDPLLDGQDVTVDSAGLVSYDGTGTPGHTDGIRACFQSDFIRADGAQSAGTTCSDASFNVDAPEYQDPVTGHPANFNAVVTIQ